MKCWKVAFSTLAVCIFASCKHPVASSDKPRDGGNQVMRVQNDSNKLYGNEPCIPMISDLRFAFEPYEKLMHMTKSKECLLIFGSTERLHKTNVFVGNGMRLSDVFQGDISAFLDQSRILILKQHSALRRPGFRESDPQRIRQSFFNTTIQAGDIVWVPPLIE